MTGNDIVDIATAAAESDWKRKGFLEKIFTPQERQYVQKGPYPDKIVWALWSMKESAYKIYIRQFGGRFFSPQRINCTLLSSCTGHVTINKIVYNTNTIFTKNYIYSVARMIAHKVAPFSNQCFHNNGYPCKIEHNDVNERIISCYAASTGKKKNNLVIIKDVNGIPSLLCKKEKIRIPVSITHHGRYAAFTIN